MAYDVISEYESALAESDKLDRMAREAEDAASAAKQAVDAALVEERAAEVKLAAVLRKTGPLHCGPDHSKYVYVISKGDRVERITAKSPYGLGEIELDDAPAGPAPGPGAKRVVLHERYPAPGPQAPPAVAEAAVDDDGGEEWEVGDPCLAEYPDGSGEFRPGTITEIKHHYWGIRFDIAPETTRWRESHEIRRPAPSDSAATAFLGTQADPAHERAMAGEGVDL